MPGKAQSDAQKQRSARKQHDDLMQRAILAYQVELTKPPFGRKGARTICRDFMNMYRQETGQTISLCYQTLLQRAKGRPTRADRGAAESWLKEAKVDIVISYVQEMEQRGFPLSHRRLKEHVDEILRARLGAKFPEEGVGRNWTQRFVEKYSDRLKTSWSRPLDTKRGRAVNPHTHDAYFTLLEDTINKYQINQDCIYAVDEVGFQTGTGQSERVIGAQKKGPHYQQKDGNRENITVLVTICADGTSTPPAVIMKGSAYQVKWKQDNPANASLGYSKKGWTDGEIGVEWIKQFDKQTERKAAGRDRLLLVDGHNSHYTRAFLEYAREHHIHILCYPAHSTHVYQGLDVAVFGVLKLYWSQERDKWQRLTGEKIDKTNFLTVYGKAHIRALTPETIRSAFRTTGVWPLNRNAISEDLMAPSKETSCEGDLPVRPATPVRLVAKLLQDLALRDAGTELDAPSRPSTSPTPSRPATPLAGPSFTQHQQETMLAATRSLQARDPSIFPSQIPIAAHETLLNVTHLISPVKSRNPDLLAIIPKTETERELLRMVQEDQRREAQLKAQIRDLQATNILNTVYCNTLRKHLAHSEKKKKASGSKRGKLVGDGLPRLLTGDDFYGRVVEFVEWQEREDKEKAEKKTKREKRAKALQRWKDEETARKAANKATTKAWQEEVDQWKAAKEEAKAAKKCFRVKKPVREKLLRPIPKPVVVSDEEGDEESDEEGWESAETVETD